MKLLRSENIATWLNRDVGTGKEIEQSDDQISFKAPDQKEKLEGKRQK